MHTAKRLLAVAGLLVLGSIGSATAAQRTYADGVTVGHVYVNDNTAGTNTIAAFDRLADGSLSTTAGSPFAVGGAGTGAGIGSQGSLQLSSDGKFLLAADAGSNQISVAQIGSDGSLTPVSGSPFSSGGIKPVSIAVHGGLVYVANAGAGGSNYTGFTLNSAGALTPLSNSTVALSNSANPGDVLFNSTGANSSASKSVRLPDHPSSTASWSGPMVVSPLLPARRSLRREPDRSGVSSGRRMRRSCSSPTPTTAAATSAPSPASK